MTKEETRLYQIEYRKKNKDIISYKIKEKIIKENKFIGKFRSEFGYKQYIYLITHPKFNGWVKLGRTTDLKNRMCTYQVGCPLREYQYSYFNELPLEDIGIIEGYFKKNIEHNGFEWFKITIEEAIIVIENLIATK